MAGEAKPTIEHLSIRDDADGLEVKGDDVQHSGLGTEFVRSAWDDLSYKETVKMFWRGILVCFVAAFSAFTDGYQVRASFQTMLMLFRLR